MAELYAQIDFREVKLGSQKEILKACVESEHVEDYEVVAEDEGESGLAVGDIVFNDTVAIERKAPTDFVESMKSGHLEDQLDRMYEEYDHVYVLVSGSAHETMNLPRSNVPEKAIRAFRASMAVRWQTPPMFCEDERDLAFTAIDVARKAFEPLKRHPGRPEVEVDDELGPVGQAVMISDDIGPEMAKRIEDSGEFWTVGDLCSASMDELTEIEGIGPKTASKVKSKLQ